MNKALIVVDYQKDFVDGALGFSGAELLDRPIAERIRERRAEGYDIIFTLDTHTTEYLSSAEGRSLPVAHCIENTPGHDLYGETAREYRPGDTLLEKPTFGSDRLFYLLKAKLYDRIELVGLVSNICVLSNAVIAKAACPEAEISVDGALTSGGDKKLDSAAREILKGLFIEVL